MDKPKIEIEYRPALFHRRVLANLLDILLLAAVFVGLFLGVRSIVHSQDFYKEQETTLNTIKKDSGLYKEKQGELVDIVYFLKNEDLTGVGKKELSIKAIEDFFAYAEINVSQEDYANLVKGYDEYRMKEGMSYNGVSYFIKNGDVIEENPDCKAVAQKYFEAVYAPYIDDVLQGFLIAKVPHFAEIIKDQGLLLFFGEIIPCYAFAGILVYLVPPLCFFRTRYTLGKALYHIGLTDKRLLSLPTGKFLGRFAIFYFAELLLSLATFAIPFIISFSLMAFSKRKQGFPDYLLGIVEIDLSDNRLYRNYDEIRLSQIDPSKKAVDFHMISRD